MHKSGVSWYADNNIWDAERASLAAYNSGKVADTYSWWCNSGGGKTAGIAFRGTLCRTQGSNTNLNEMQETVAASGFVITYLNLIFLLYYILMVVILKQIRY